MQDQLGLQGAGRLDALQDRDDAVGLDAEPVEAAHQRFEIGTVDHRDARVGLARLDRGVRLDGGLALARMARAGRSSASR